VLTYAGDLWQRTVDEVGADFAGVEVDYVHVDAMCLYLVTVPERFDVVVTDNLFGDIITDLGAAVQGGLGLAASGIIDPTRTSRACSSRSTARRPTSPVGDGPTRPPPCCRRRCVSLTWERSRPPPRWRRPRAPYCPRWTRWAARHGRVHPTDRRPHRRARGGRPGGRKHAMTYRRRGRGRVWLLVTGVLVGAAVAQELCKPGAERE